MMGLALENQWQTRHVQTTYNYKQFKKLNGNRPMNMLHRRRLLQSMKLSPLFTVIIVNENMEVIDGQHRLSCIEELGLPVNYVVAEGYGIHQVQILNANSKNWTSQEYLDGYCQLGMSHYIKFAEFRQKYPFGWKSCFAILATDGGGAMSAFREGAFKIRNYQQACDFAERIMLVSQYYTGSNRDSFVLAMLKVIKKPEFSIGEFLSKLKLKQSELVDCATIDQYLILIEEIYNYKRREKVNLRF